MPDIGLSELIIVLAYLMLIFVVAAILIGVMIMIVRAIWSRGHRSGRAMIRTPRRSSSNWSHSSTRRGS